MWQGPRRFRQLCAITAPFYLTRHFALLVCSPSKLGIFNAYVQLVLMYAGINIILSTSLNIVNGYMGEFSVGHAGFMAVGAYVTSILNVMLFTSSSIFGPPLLSPSSAIYLFPVTLIAGGAAAALAGLLVAVPSFKTRGDYLAIITLAVNYIVKELDREHPADRRRARFHGHAQCDRFNGEGFKSPMGHDLGLHIGWRDCLDNPAACKFDLRQRHCRAQGRRNCGRDNGHKYTADEDSGFHALLRVGGNSGGSFRARAGIHKPGVLHHHEIDRSACYGVSGRNGIVERVGDERDYLYACDGGPEAASGLEMGRGAVSAHSSNDLPVRGDHGTQGTHRHFPESAQVVCAKRRAGVKWLFWK